MTTMRQKKKSSSSKKRKNPPNATGSRPKPYPLKRSSMTHKSTSNATGTSNSRLLAPTAASQAKLRQKVEMHENGSSSWIKYGSPNGSDNAGAVASNLLLSPRSACSDSPMGSLSSPPPPQQASNNHDQHHHHQQQNHYAWNRLINDPSLRKKLKDKFTGQDLLNHLHHHHQEMGSPNGGHSSHQDSIARKTHIKEIRQKLLDAIKEEDSHKQPLQERRVIAEIPEGESVSILNQVNLDFYSEEALVAREELALDTELSFYIHQMWRGMKKASNGLLDKDTYIQMCSILYDLLVPDGDEEHRRQTAEDDWKHDAAGNEQMTQDQFMKAIFNAVDIWTQTTSVQEYRDFVREIHSSVSREAIKRGLDIMEKYTPIEFNYENYLRLFHSEQQEQPPKQEQQNHDKSHQGDSLPSPKRRRASQKRTISPQKTPPPPQQQPVDERLEREKQERDAIFEQARLEEEEQLKHLIEINDDQESTHSQENVVLTPKIVTTASSPEQQEQSPTTREAEETRNETSDESDSTKLDEPLLSEDEAPSIHSDDDMKAHEEDDVSFADHIRRANTDLEKLRAWRIQKQKDLQDLLAQQEQRRYYLEKHGKSMGDDDLKRIQEILNRTQNQINESMEKEEKLSNQIQSTDEAEQKKEEKKPASAPKGQKKRRAGVSQRRKLPNPSSSGNQMQLLNTIPSSSSADALNDLHKNETRSTEDKTEQDDQHEKTEPSADNKPIAYDRWMMPPSKKKKSVHRRRKPRVRAGISSSVSLAAAAPGTRTGSESHRGESQKKAESQQARTTTTVDQQEKPHKGGQQLRSGQNPQFFSPPQPNKAQLTTSAGGKVLLLGADIPFMSTQHPSRYLNMAHFHTGSNHHNAHQQHNTPAQKEHNPLFKSFGHFPRRAPLGRHRLQRSVQYPGVHMQQQQHSATLPPGYHGTHQNNIGTESQEQPSTVPTAFTSESSNAHHSQKLSPPQKQEPSLSSHVTNQKYSSNNYGDWGSAKTAAQNPRSISPKAHAMQKMDPFALSSGSKAERQHAGRNMLNADMSTARRVSFTVFNGGDLLGVQGGGKGRAGFQ